MRGSPRGGGMSIVVHGVNGITVGLSFQDGDEKGDVWWFKSSLSPTQSIPGLACNGKPLGHSGKMR
jgi:hypothetical protein